MLDSKLMTELTYYLPDKISSTKLADFFALLSDGNRLRLLSALAMSRLCVGDLATLLEMNQTAISHQLKLLRSMGVVRFSRSGKAVFYELADTKINEVLLMGVEYIGF
ncbi:MAG: metalloregulator ArsR/SmtB family transcription factor [Clostridia bacterium]|nr:metalloregulator ArsR/SmtB family transcription factor [Clostridia bacterium]